MCSIKVDAGARITALGVWPQALLSPLVSKGYSRTVGLFKDTRTQQKTPAMRGSFVGCGGNPC